MPNVPKKGRGVTAPHPRVGPLFSVEYEVSDFTKGTLFTPGVLSNDWGKP